MASTDSCENYVLSRLEKQFQDEITRLVSQSEQEARAFYPRETYSDGEDLFDIADAPQTSESSETPEISVQANELEDLLNAQSCSPDYCGIINLASYLIYCCENQYQACFPADIDCQKPSGNNEVHDTTAKPPHCEASAGDFSYSFDSAWKADLFVELTDEERREIMRAVDGA